MLSNPRESRVACEECGLVTKTVPKSKKCARCRHKVFIFINKKGQKREIDFRTETEKDTEDRPYLGYYMGGIY